VIKQGVLTRLDARRLIPVDVKVIATTTVDLANLVEQNRFSRQLYYALHSFEIVIPPLARGVTVFLRWCTIALRAWKSAFPRG
jgi:transcriptional regulator of acetoin/glycerol metabolism